MSCARVLVSQGTAAPVPSDTTHRGRARPNRRLASKIPTLVGLLHAMAPSMNRKEDSTRLASRAEVTASDAPRLRRENVGKTSEKTPSSSRASPGSSSAPCASQSSLLVFSETPRDDARCVTGSVTTNASSTPSGTSTEDEPPSSSSSARAARRRPRDSSFSSASSSMYQGAAVVARSASTAPILCSPGRSPAPRRPSAEASAPTPPPRWYERSRTNVEGCRETSDETRHTRGGTGRRFFCDASSSSSSSSSSSTTTRRSSSSSRAPAAYHLGCAAAAYRGWFASGPSMSLMTRSNAFAAACPGPRRSRS